MNIIYGLSGEGYGHSSRAQVILPFLKKLGHNVKVITYGKAFEILEGKYEIFQIHGMHLVFEEDILKKRKTFLENLKNYPKNLSQSKEINKFVGDFHPDLFITDYEPTTYLLSKIYKKPLISVGNHHMIDNYNLKVPKKFYSQKVLTKIINKLFTPSADFFILTTFLKVKARNKNTILVAPIVREEVIKLKPKNKGKILVYLNKTDQILETLKGINEKFVVYGFNIKKKEGNLEFKTKENFLKDLQDCKAIISTAGFSLISEAIYLKKPFLAIPQKGQFEQIFNSITLKQAGFGEYFENPTEKQIGYYLKNLKEYERHLRNYNPDYNEIFTALKTKISSISQHKLAV